MYILDVASTLVHFWCSLVYEQPMIGLHLIWDSQLSFTTAAEPSAAIKSFEHIANTG